MANQRKFEEMLEKLIAEDKAGAEELFHEIVVEKSRDIYESILESEVDDEEVDESNDEEVDEAKDDDDEEVSEDFDLDEFEVEADPMMGGDAADAMIGDAEPDMDMDMDDMGDEGDEGGEEEIEDRVEDLEDALDELKAEFEAMMADHGDDDEAPADDEGAMDDMEADDEGDADADDEGDDDDDEEMESTESKSEAEQMREYVEKVSAKMGDNGANAKSVVAGPNDMGGDASNLAQGGEESGMKAGGAKEDNMGNVNVPGGKAAKSMSKNAKGHGAEKKGSGESADNKKSTIGS